MVLMLALKKQADVTEDETRPDVIVDVIVEHIRIISSRDQQQHVTGDLSPPHSTLPHITAFISNRIIPKPFTVLWEFPPFTEQRQHFVNISLTNMSNFLTFALYN